jgi:ferredoxin
MTPFCITESSLKHLVDQLAKEQTVMAPVKEGSGFSFKRIANGEGLCLDFTNSTVPPKSVLLPQLEELFTYEVKSGKVRTAGSTGGDTVTLIGVRPCDSSAFSVLDRVMGGEYIDPYYSRNRERTLVLGVSCSRPEPTCFCNVFGTGPVEGSSDDISLTRVDSGYVTRPKTKKGREFIEKHTEYFREATQKELELFELESSRVNKSMEAKLKSEGLPERMSKAFDDPYWQELSRRCIECGVCSFICPTCYCFDVVEEVNGNQGRRSRGWDTCQSCRFSKMAGGLDPRPTKPDRLKHRFYHKLQYMPMTFGAISCVGCGRCVSRCPSNVDIREVIAKWQ